MSQKKQNVKVVINKVQSTGDCISSRGGLALVSRYIRSTNIIQILADRFSIIRKSSKGIGLLSLFHQIICYFFDGSYFHLTGFDHLANDEGYAAAIETPDNKMVSSHSVKRFFNAIDKIKVRLFREVLRRLFIWRLNIEKPEIIKLGIDTMVLDNDEALKREGVDPTYKKVKGFQPLQMYWGRYIVDAIFRNGKAHSNHGNHVATMVTKIVKLIRQNYSNDVPILLMADTGFFDIKLLKHFDSLKIGFVVGGKMYSDIQQVIADTPDNEFYKYTKKNKTWFYTEFMDKRKSWDTEWRTIYSKPISDDNGQILLEFARPETIIYTNIGMDNEITRKILSIKDTTETIINPQAIITLYHERGRDELVNRGLKNFGNEQLPFKRFASNAAFYYMMVISFFLFETFKYDIDCETIPLQWYAGTFRRLCLDIASKIVRTARQVILKITKATFERLNFDLLWSQSICKNPIE